jgi:hypothetical protein
MFLIMSITLIIKIFMYYKKRKMVKINKNIALGVAGIAAYKLKKSNNRATCGSSNIIEQNTNDDINNISLKTVDARQREINRMCGDDKKSNLTIVQELEGVWRTELRNILHADYNKGKSNESSNALIWKKLEDIIYDADNNVIGAHYRTITLFPKSGNVIPNETHETGILNDYAGKTGLISLSLDPLSYNGRFIANYIDNNDNTNGSFTYKGGTQYNININENNGFIAIYQRHRISDRKICQMLENADFNIIYQSLWNAKNNKSN